MLAARGCLVALRTGRARLVFTGHCGRELWRLRGVRLVVVGGMTIRTTCSTYSDGGVSLGSWDNAPAVGRKVWMEVYTYVEMLMVEGNEKTVRNCELEEK